MVMGLRTPYKSGVGDVEVATLFPPTETVSGSFPKKPFPHMDAVELPSVMYCVSWYLVGVEAVNEA